MSATHWRQSMLLFEPETVVRWHRDLVIPQDREVPSARWPIFRAYRTIDWITWDAHTPSVLRSVRPCRLQVLEAQRAMQLLVNGIIASPTRGSLLERIESRHGIAFECTLCDGLDL